MNGFTPLFLTCELSLGWRMAVRVFRRGLACSVPPVGRVWGSLEGNVGRIFIDNPLKRNAMTLSMYSDVPQAVKASCGGRVTVLSGAGSEAFGAGSDITEFPAVRTGVSAAAEYSRIETAASEALLSIRHPLLASIRGPCIGGGLNLALTADIRIASEDATFSVPPARLGIGYPRELMDLLVAAVGRTNAKELLFTAKAIGAEDAMRMGLVNEVVPEAELDAHVMRMATGIAKLAPLTLEAAKALAHDRDGADEAYLRCYESADYQEGVDAFIGKRRASFKGL
jgi:enoyl-CoA hydratase